MTCGSRSGWPGPGATRARCGRRRRRRAPRRPGGAAPRGGCRRAAHRRPPGRGPRAGSIAVDPRAHLRPAARRSSARRADAADRRHRANAGRAACSAGTCSSRWHSADATAASAAGDGGDQEGRVGAGDVDDLAGDGGADGDAEAERRADPGERLGHRRPRHEQLGEGEGADQRRRHGDPGEDDERHHHPDVARPAAAGRSAPSAARSTPASRRRSGSRQCTVPQPMPLAIEPSARPAMSTPDMRLRAHLVGEGDQRDLQRAEDRADRAARPRTARAGRGCASPTGPCGSSWPPGGGSVRRCAANSRLPTVARVKAVTTPLVAWPVVDRKVTSTGPDDEDELVDHRLHRQRRRQPVAAAQQVRPAHPDHRGDRRDARPGDARRRGTPSTAASRP